MANIDRARCAAETANIDREGPPSSVDALEASGPALESVGGPLLTPKSVDAQVR